MCSPRKKIKPTVSFGALRRQGDLCSGLGEMGCRAWEAEPPPEFSRKHSSQLSAGCRVLHEHHYVSFPPPTLQMDDKLETGGVTFNCAFINYYFIFVSKPYSLWAVGWEMRPSPPGSRSFFHDEVVPQAGGPICTDSAGCPIPADIRVPWSPASCETVPSPLAGSQTTCSKVND